MGKIALGISLPFIRRKLRLFMSRLASIQSAAIILKIVLMRIDKLLNKYLMLPRLKQGVMWKHLTQAQDNSSQLL